MWSGLKKLVSGSRNCLQWGIMLLSSAQRAGLNIGYRTHILWMYTYECSLICQDFVNLANPPLTRHLSFRSPAPSNSVPDLTIFISDSSIFQSSDFTPTVQPDPASHHHSSVPDPPQLHLTLSTAISPRSYLHFLQIWPSLHPLRIALTGTATAAR